MATLVIRFKGKRSMLVKIDWHYMSIFFSVEICEGSNDSRRKVYFWTEFVWYRA